MKARYNPITPNPTTVESLDPGDLFCVSTESGAVTWTDDCPVYMRTQHATVKISDGVVFNLSAFPGERWARRLKPYSIEEDGTSVFIERTET